MTATSPTLRWGIIGPGGIAQAFVRGLQGSRTGKLVAIGTRDPKKPGLAENFPGARIHQGYEALLADPEVDAVYIATLHPTHAEWAIKAAEAGKHVLVEKPIALNAYDAEAMFHAARKAGTFMGEAFMYRLHPLIGKLVQTVKDGAIGEVRVIHTSFGFMMPKVMPEHRLYANDLAGGGILDVGCYTASISRLIAGAALGKPFANPVKMFGTAKLGETGVDEWAAATLQFEGGILANLSCGVSINLDNVLRIHGTKGRIEVKDFWFAAGQRDGDAGTFSVIRDGKTEEIGVDKQGALYSYEADGVADAIAAGKTEFASPGMTWDDTLGNMRVLDEWRKGAGLTYGIETPARRKTTVANRTLAARGPQIPKTQIAGVRIPTSKVAMGFEFYPSFAAASVTLDGFHERGGNLFDTGYIYMAGKTEEQLGDWHTSRGVKRKDFAIIGKGAHSPLHYPDVVSKQLDQTLERLKTDYVDVYFLHRDNVEVPVGEFVDAVDAEVKAGRIRGPWGGSNWSRERMDAAIKYAKRKGKQGPTALSNNFSLAEMMDPVWAGCVSAYGDAWRKWLTKHEITNFAWSSQARGFFTDRAGPDKRDDEEMVRVWYSEGNFERRERAIKLAAKLGRKPIHIALAYVLAQPFASVPLIGPRNLTELEDSLSALDIELSDKDVKWLEKGRR